MGIKKLGIGSEPKKASFEELKQRCVVAQGWSDSGDLSFLTESAENLDKFLPLFNQGEQSGTNAFNQFFRSIKTGDIILGLEGNSIKGIGEIPNDFIYFFDDERTDNGEYKYHYRNCVFPVTWVDWKDFCTDEKLWKQHGRVGASGIVNCNENDINQYIEQYWEHYKKDKKINIQPIEQDAKLQKLKEQLPEKIKSSKKRYDELLNKHLNKTTQMDMLKSTIDLLKHKKQIILQGPPGTGKTWLAKLMAEKLTNFNLKNGEDLNINTEIVSGGQYKIIQFHPAYSYEDFVRGIVASTESGNVSYHVENKILADFAQKAQDSPNDNYVLIIDEINRANLPAVLGELIYALEYRSDNDAIDSMYEFEGDRKIILPQNLFIIGTMNTADRSVGTIDYAIRRRFAFIDMLPKILDVDGFDENLFRKVSQLFIKNYDEYIKDSTVVLERSEFLSDEFRPEDIWLGHSYFIMTNAEGENVRDIRLKYEILPILKEYLKDGILKSGAETIIAGLK
ncbi:hypothetical protein FACS189464_0020 [Bacteroidia bacterium]|nr:hypothetical protein FACS189464_0020 [Bacteroidia bacterium]